MIRSSAIACLLAAACGFSSNLSGVDGPKRQSDSAGRESITYFRGAGHINDWNPSLAAQDAVESIRKGEFLMHVGPTNEDEVLGVPYQLHHLLADCLLVYPGFTDVVMSEDLARRDRQVAYGILYNREVIRFLLTRSGRSAADLESALADTEGNLRARRELINRTSLERSTGKHPTLASEADATNGPSSPVGTGWTPNAQVTGLTALNVTSDAFQLRWDPLPGAVAYEVRIESGESRVIGESFLSFAGMEPGQARTIQVRGKASDGANSGWSQPLTARTLEAIPSMHGPARVSKLHPTYLTLNYGAKTASVPSAYQVRINGEIYGSSRFPMMVIGGLQPGGSYSFTVRVQDRNGTWSSFSEPTVVTTPAGNGSAWFDLDGDGLTDEVFNRGPRFNYTTTIRRAHQRPWRTKGWFPHRGDGGQIGINLTVDGRKGYRYGIYLTKDSLLTGVSGARLVHTVVAETNGSLVLDLPPIAQRGFAGQRVQIVRYAKPPRWLRIMEEDRLLAESRIGSPIPNISPMMHLTIQLVDTAGNLIEDGPLIRWSLRNLSGVMIPVPNLGRSDILFMDFPLFESVSFQAGFSIDAMPAVNF